MSLLLEFGDLTVDQEAEQSTKKAFIVMTEYVPSGVRFPVTMKIFSFFPQIK